MREPTFLVDAFGRALYEGDVAVITVNTILGPMFTKAAMRFDQVRKTYDFQFEADDRLLDHRFPATTVPIRLGSIYENPKLLDA